MMPVEILLKKKTITQFGLSAFESLRLRHLIDQKKEEDKTHSGLSAFEEQIKRD